MACAIARRSRPRWPGRRPRLAARICIRILAAKAAALLHSLVLNHAFVDGNKRVGAHAAVLFLLVNGTGLIAAPAALAEVTLTTARGEMSAEALAIWFRQRSRPLEP